MTKIAAVWLTLFLTGLGFAKGAPDGKVLVRRGTGLEFAVRQKLDPRTVQRGDLVTLRLRRALVVEGSTILPVDFETKAIVAKVRRPNKDGDGEVLLKVRSIHCPDGTIVRTAEIDQIGGHTATPVTYPGAMLPRGWGSWLGLIPLRVVQAAMFAPLVPFVAVTVGFWLVTSDNPPTPVFSAFNLPEDSTIGIAVLKDVWVRR